MKVALIGGTGKMGKLVGDLLLKHDFIVYSVGRKSADFDQKIKQAEIVMFSVPISAFDETVKELEKKSARLGLQDKLLVDLSSLVSGHMEKMQELSPHTAFMHLMFGPDILI